MELKHTPAPWTYTYGQGIDGGRFIIDSNTAHAIACTAGFEPMNEANARLISAAPDLLMALDSLLPYAAAHRLARIEGTQCREALDKARAAIEKAITGPSIAPRLI